MGEKLKQAGVVGLGGIGASGLLFLISTFFTKEDAIARFTQTDKAIETVQVSVNTLKEDERLKDERIYLEIRAMNARFDSLNLFLMQNARRGR